MRIWRFALRMAWRYLFSRKNRNAIHLITGLSMLAIAVVSAALVILLSAFNGLEWKVIGLFDIMDPPLLAVPSNRKSLELTDNQALELSQLEALHGYSKVIDESALFSYGNQQRVGSIKGVEPVFFNQVPIDSMLVAGDLTWPNKQSQAQAWIGEGLATALGIRIGEPFKQLIIYCPKSGGIDLFNPFRELNPQTQGIFFIPQETNETLAILPLEHADQLTGAKGRVTSLYIYPKSKKHGDEIQSKVQKILGNDWRVKNRLEQHELIYKVLRTEKAAVFLIVAFIMAIASFNLMSVQTLLVVEKRKDLMVLWCLGAHAQLLRRIFTLLGTLVSFLGSLGGMLLGLAIVAIQHFTGWYPLNASGEAYPVIVYLSDLLLIFLSVFSTGLLISWWRMRLVRFRKEEAIEALK